MGVFRECVLIFVSRQVEVVAGFELERLNQRILFGNLVVLCRRLVVGLARGGRLGTQSAGNNWRLAEFVLDPELAGRITVV